MSLTAKATRFKSQKKLKFRMAKTK